MKAKPNLVLKDILNFDRTIRIPVSGSVPLAEEARLIIETPTFQRLRGVRQLGPTHFVYPGAIHTRFEHSLGTYALSLKYAEALLARKEIYDFPENAADMVKLLVASALLHDIGHYPFSHLFEEIGPLPGMILRKHEERAAQLIMDTEIQSILVNNWKISPLDVCNAIKGLGLKGGYAVMSSALSSVLDLDKLDYLIRDSVHCGVSFGLALDTGRFLTGLHIDKENACICLSTKSESHIPALMTVRNLMYNEVYWHKTVRACGAMLKTLIYYLSEFGILNKNELLQLFRSQDDSVAFRLYKLATKRKINHLCALAAPFIFKNRELFKMVYFLGMSFDDANARPNAKSFFKSILDDHTASVAMCVQKAKSLEKAIRHFCQTIRPGDIIIEYTPVKPGHESFPLTNMRLLNERTGKYVTPSYAIEATDNQLANSRRIFVFCHPQRSNICSGINNQEWEKIFYEATNQPYNTKIKRKKYKRQNTFPK